MDFDLVMKNIRELNILAGEGCSDVTRTKDGARLKVHQWYISRDPFTIYCFSQEYDFSYDCKGSRFLIWKVVVDGF